MEFNTPNKQYFDNTIGKTVNRFDQNRKSDAKDIVDTERKGIISFNEFNACITLATLFNAEPTNYIPFPIKGVNGDFYIRHHGKVILRDF